MEEIITKFLQEVILGEGVFILVVAYVLGDIIKRTTPINNQFIPLIISLISAVVAVFTPFLEGDIVVKILKGIISGWAATGGYETVRNIIATIKEKKAVKKQEE